VLTPDLGVDAAKAAKLLEVERGIGPPLTGTPYASGWEPDARRKALTSAAFYGRQ
jgi:hypothetical protein